MAKLIDQEMSKRPLFNLISEDGLSISKNIQKGYHMETLNLSYKIALTEEIIKKQKYREVNFYSSEKFKLEDIHFDP